MVGEFRTSISEEGYTYFWSMVEVDRQKELVGVAYHT